MSHTIPRTIPRRFHAGRAGPPGTARRNWGVGRLNGQLQSPLIVSWCAFQFWIRDTKAGPFFRHRPTKMFSGACCAIGRPIPIPTRTATEIFDLSTQTTIHKIPLPSTSSHKPLENRVGSHKNRGSVDAKGKTIQTLGSSPENLKVKTR